MKEKIYYELALFINKEMYDEKLIPHDIYLKTEESLLRWIYH